jgi:hypothetical protein
VELAFRLSQWKVYAVSLSQSPWGTAKGWGTMIERCLIEEETGRWMRYRNFLSYGERCSRDAGCYTDRELEVLSVNVSVTER